MIAGPKPNGGREQRAPNLLRKLQRAAAMPTAQAAAAVFAMAAIGAATSAMPTPLQLSTFVHAAACANAAYLDAESLAAEPVTFAQARCERAALKGPGR